MPTAQSKTQDEIVQVAEVEQRYPDEWVLVEITQDHKRHERVKGRLLALSDSRITLEGVFVLKAQQHRTQEMNRADALLRLQEVIDSVAVPPKPRRATKPTYGSKQRRLAGKSQRSEIKNLRGKVND